MNAVISGQAGVAVLVNGLELASMHAGRDSEVIGRRPEEIRFLLGDARDLDFVEDVDAQEVSRRLEIATTRYDALHIALILLDESLSHDTRREAAEELEELLEDPEVAGFPERVLFSHPFPRGADPSGARMCCTGHTPKTRQLLNRLVSMQTLIAEVHEAWERIPGSLFGSAADRAHALAMAVREGLFLDLVLDRAARKPIETFRIKALLNRGFQGVRNHPDILREWTAFLREPDWGFPEYVSPSRKAWSVAENAMADNELGQANVLRAQGRHAEALEIYEKIVAERPVDVEARRGMAEVLDELGYLGEVLAGGL